MTSSFDLICCVDFNFDFDFFKKLNPSWSVHLYTPNTISNEVSWRDKGNDNLHRCDQRDYKKTEDLNDTNCYVLNTCHIREKATEKVYHDIGRLKKAFQEHRAVIKALEKNDVALAREKMRTHLNQLILLLTPLEKKHPHLFENS